MIIKTMYEYFQCMDSDYCAAFIYHGINKLHYFFQVCKGGYGCYFTCIDNLRPAYGIEHRMLFRFIKRCHPF